MSDLLDKERLGSRQLALEIGGHDGIRSVPESIQSQSLIFATMRDPWSWYASIDAHYRHKGRFDGFLLELFGKVVPFKEVVRLLTGNVSDRALLYRDVRYPGARVHEEKLASKISASGLGLYSWLAIRMFCNDEIETVEGLDRVLHADSDLPWSIHAAVDTAQVRDGLMLVLQAYDPDVAMKVQESVRVHPAQNERSRYRGVMPNGQPDPSVYDQEMQEWVLRADSWMMQRFQFHLPVGQRSPITLLK